MVAEIDSNTISPFLRLQRKCSQDALHEIGESNEQEEVFGRKYRRN